jgi:hypothetical protein
MFACMLVFMVLADTRAVEAQDVFLPEDFPPLEEGIATFDERFRDPRLTSLVARLSNRGVGVLVLPIYQQLENEQSFPWSGAVSAYIAEAQRRYGFDPLEPWIALGVTISPLEVDGELSFHGGGDVSPALIALLETEQSLGWTGVPIAPHQPVAAQEFADQATKHMLAGREPEAIEAWIRSFEASLLSVAAGVEWSVPAQTVRAPPAWWSLRNGVVMGSVALLAIVTLVLLYRQRLELVEIDVREAAGRLSTLLVDTSSLDHPAFLPAEAALHSDAVLLRTLYIEAGGNADDALDAEYADMVDGLAAAASAFAELRADVSGGRRTLLARMRLLRQIEGQVELASRSAEFARSLHVRWLEATAEARAHGRSRDA